MNAADFRRILTAFADRPADVDLSKGTLVLELRGELREARVLQRQGDLFVVEGDDHIPASQWIIRNVARLPEMANRILDYTKEVPYFVTPAGDLLDRLDLAPTDEQQQVADTLDAALKFLDLRPAGATSILYLTSDAGEGKTSLITQMAREQARRYKQKETDWLLVPISLGGRNFIRFDDVVVGELMNDYRFSYWYYGAFLELVRMGVVIPAFDGFEEMFVENSEGDAISALGNLVQSMQSEGTALIAARKAYFEYKSLKTQSRLHDSRGGQSVSFARLGLRRWDRTKFVEYGCRRGVADAEAIFDEVAVKLNSADHPLLTRAVLVRQLFKVADEANGRDGLLRQIQSHPDDYFRQFVGSIIHRESQDKWLMKGGDDIKTPLIPESEHYELLAMVALEMWRDGTESLRSEVLDITAELFGESKKKDKVVSRQLIERLKGHALIVQATGHRFAFDHQEFFHFFLGEGIGKVLATNNRSFVASELRPSTLPDLTAQVAARFLRRVSVQLPALVATANQIALTEPRASFVKENLAGVLIRALDGCPAMNVRFEHALFPPQALAGRVLNGVEFLDCYFQSSSLAHSQLTSCQFIRCEFEALELSNGVTDTTLDGCTVRSVTPVGVGGSVFAPQQVQSALVRAGFQFPASLTEVVDPVETEEQVTLVERMLRAFTRQSQINENVLSTRLGVGSHRFFTDVLPQLQRVGVVQEVTYAGRGQQKRFQLGRPLQGLTDAVEGCEGRFDRFLELVVGNAN